MNLVKQVGEEIVSSLYRLEDVEGYSDHVTVSCRVPVKNNHVSCTVYFSGGAPAYVECIIDDNGSKSHELFEAAVNNYVEQRLSGSWLGLMAFQTAKDKRLEGYYGED